MLEVMLAGSLGLIVIFIAMGFFTTIDRAKRFQAQRLEVNTERTTAHRVIQQALRSLLMEDGAGRDDDVKKRIEDDIQHALDHADEPDDDASIVRFSLEPDPAAYGPDGRPVQTLELTVTTPPIHAVTLRTDAEQAEAQDLREMMNQRLRKLDLWDSSRSSAAALDAKAGNSKSASSRSASNSKDSATAIKDAERDANRTASRADRLRAASVGLTGSEASSDALDAAAQREIDAPRAPGLRGMFEIRPDPDARPSTDGSSNGPALSLWWRQIPPEADLVSSQQDGLGGIDDPQLLQLARRSLDDAPQIKILSNLKSARWRVYRRRQFVEKMTAKSAKELPAYVEFKFETLDGRHDNWLFEVAWSYGAEPGTIIATNDPLGAPLDSTDLNAQIQQAVQAAIDGKNPSGSPVGGSQVAGTTGGNGLSNLGTGGGQVGGTGLKTPQNTTRAEIDAILRQFGFGK
jgi:hypothetical protein